MSIEGLKVKTVAIKNKDAMQAITFNNNSSKVRGTVNALSNGEHELVIGKEISFLIVRKSSSKFSNEKCYFTTRTIERFTSDFIVFSDTSKLAKSKVLCIFRGN